PLTGFVAVGLSVGIAGLGVISPRAVVERWQQIGMLRALGYRRSLVQRSFLMESSFIAVLGLAIGSLVGLWQSYRFFVTDRTFGTVIFNVPLVDIGLILAGAYLATLLTTYLPSRAAARVPPAQALRYDYPREAHPPPPAPHRRRGPEVCPSPGGGGGGGPPGRLSAHHTRPGGAGPPRHASPNFSPHLYVCAVPGGRGRALLRAVLIRLLVSQDSGSMP